MSNNNKSPYSGNELGEELEETSRHDYERNLRNHLKSAEKLEKDVENETNSKPYNISNTNMTKKILGMDTAYPEGKPVHVEIAQFEDGHYFVVDGVKANKVKEGDKPKVPIAVLSMNYGTGKQGESTIIDDDEPHTHIMKDDNGRKVTVGPPAPLTPETVKELGMEDKFIIIRGRVYNRA